MKKLSLLIVSLFIVLSAFACKSVPKEITKVEDLFGCYITTGTTNFYFLKYKGSDSKYVGVWVTVSASAVANPMRGQDGRYRIFESLSNDSNKYGLGTNTYFTFSRNGNIVTQINLNYISSISIDVPPIKKIDNKTLKKITSQIDWSNTYGDIIFS